MEFQVFSEPRIICQEMIHDIENATQSITLETYIYDADEIGDRFLHALVKKAREGVRVRVLVDAWGWWGATPREVYFKPLVKAGGEVKYFREFRYVVRVFSQNHERNHRKLLIIDRNITWIGSMNITASTLDWRELAIRLVDDIAVDFEKAFLHTWDWTNGFTPRNIKRLIHEGFEILHDMPARFHLSRKGISTEKKYLQLFRKAKHRILIETPYFVPSARVRHALAKAVKRGVEVWVVVPEVSDVRIVDLVCDRHLGKLYNQGIHIFLYNGKTLHAKLLIVDNTFILGSSNLDYRSFLHQYEINLLGKDRRILHALWHHYQETLEYCRLFSYYEWKRRSSFVKLFEMMSSWISNYL